MPKIKGLKNDVQHECRHDKIIIQLEIVLFSKSVWLIRIFIWCVIFVGLQLHTQAHILYISKSKVGDHRWGWPEGSLFNSYYIKA